MGQGLNFFTNAIDKTPSTKDSYQDVDVSGDGVPEGASGVIVEIRISSSGTWLTCALRKNGSSWLPSNSNLTLLNVGGYAFVPLDANRVFEASVSAGVELWLIGYTGSDVVYLTDPSDVSPTQTGSWVDIDMSGSIPSGATGVICLLTNTQNTYSNRGGIRCNGSTDEFPYCNLNFPWRDAKWQYCGLDANRVFEMKCNSTGVACYVYAYTKGEVTFKTNGEESSPSQANQWTDVDVTAQTASNATGVLLMVKNNHAWNTHEAHVRKNGSSDNRTTGAQLYYSEVTGDSGCCGMAIGLDAEQVYEAYVGSTADVDVYVIGYNASGATVQTVTDFLSLSENVTTDIASSAWNGGTVTNDIIIEKATPVLQLKNTSGNPELHFNDGANLMKIYGSTIPSPHLVVDSDITLEHDVNIKENLDVTENVDIGGEITADSGGVFNGFAIGTSEYGSLLYPYESIQLDSGWNLRINFGTAERAVLTNAGQLQLPALGSSGGLVIGNVNLFCSESETLKIDDKFVAASGGLFSDVAIGCGHYGSLPYPYETIQLHQYRNLRFCFGTTERAMLTNWGKLQLPSTMPLLEVDPDDWVEQNEVKDMCFDNGYNEPDVYEGVTGLLTFQDTNETNHFTSLFGIVMDVEGIGQSPALCTTHHLIVRKDLTAGGLLKSYEGGVVLHGGYAGWAPGIQPFIWLAEGGDYGNKETLEIVIWENDDWTYGDLRCRHAYQGDAVFANGWRLTEDPEESGMMLVRPDGSIAQKWR